ncbi:hypothetical protein M8C21_014178, partial [Ambrosia artemisiifolia]
DFMPRVVRECDAHLMVLSQSTKLGMPYANLLPFGFESLKLLCRRHLSRVLVAAVQSINWIFRVRPLDETAQTTSPTKKKIGKQREDNQRHVVALDCRQPGVRRRLPVATLFLRLDHLNVHADDVLFGIALALGAPQADVSMKRHKVG